MIRKHKSIASFCVAAALLLLVTSACSAQVGGGGGNSVGWMFLNLDELNEKLVGADFAEVPKGMLVFGGYGMGPVGDGNWLVGGFGGGGDATSAKGEKSTAFGLSYGGLVFAYNMELSEKACLNVGSGVGIGIAELVTKSGAISDFDTVIGAANSASVWRPYILAQPQASLSFAVSPMTNMTITGGYAFFYSPIGWVDGRNIRQSISGPLKTMGFPFVQLGIAFGGPMLPE